MSTIQRAAFALPAGGSASSSENSRPWMLAEGRNTPADVARTWVDHHFPHESTKLQSQIAGYIEKRFLQVSDPRMDGVLAGLERATRGLQGTAILERLKRVDPTQANNAAAARNMAGGGFAAVGAVFEDMIRLGAEVMGRPTVGEVLIRPDSVEQHRRAMAELDRSLDRIGAQAAARMGIDLNSPLYRQANGAAAVALLVSSALELAPGAIRLVTAGKDLALVFRDARTFERAANDPVLRKRLAIAVAHRGVSLEMLPSQTRILIRKVLKQSSADPAAARALALLPPSVPRTALINQIAKQMSLGGTQGMHGFEYQPAPGHYIHGLVHGDGSMQFSFAVKPELRPTLGGGGDMFNALMKKLKGAGVDVRSIVGDWNLKSDNLTAYRTLRAEGRSPAEAALGTPTGQLARAHGYKKAVVTLDEEKKVEVTFRR